MFQKLPVLAVIIAAVTLAACDKEQVVDTALLPKADPKLMAKAKAMPNIPADESTNVDARMKYYAQSRNVCGDTGSRLTGLQTYVASLHAGKK